MSLMRAIKFRKTAVKVETKAPTLEERVQVVTDVDAAAHCEQHKTIAARLMDDMQHNQGVHLAQIGALYNALSGVEGYTKPEDLKDGIIIYGNIQLQRKKGVVSLKEID